MIWIQDLYLFSFVQCSEMCFVVNWLYLKKRQLEGFYKLSRRKMWLSSAIKTNKVIVEKLARMCQSESNLPHGGIFCCQLYFFVVTRDCHQVIQFRGFTHAQSDCFWVLCLLDGCLMSIICKHLVWHLPRCILHFVQLNKAPWLSLDLKVPSSFIEFKRFVSQSEAANFYLFICVLVLHAKMCIFRDARCLCRI